MKQDARPAKRHATQKAGAHTLGGSETARRQAAVLLEVLSGIRGTQEAADALGVQLTRYYVLETRGLQGLIDALEPRPRGRVKTPEQTIEALRTDNERLKREIERSRALVRALERSIGVAQPASLMKGKGRKVAGKHGKTTRTRRRTVVRRAERAIAALQQPSDPTPEASSAETSERTP